MPKNGGHNDAFRSFLDMAAIRRQIKRLLDIVSTMSNVPPRLTMTFQCYAGSFLPRLICFFRLSPFFWSGNHGNDNRLRLPIHPLRYRVLRPEKFSPSTIDGLRKHPGFQPSGNRRIRNPCQFKNFPKYKQFFH